MYAEAFGLRAEPFAPTPDPNYLVLTPDHREALAALEYGLRERRGFLSLVGEVGTGKTTLLYTLMRRVAGEIDIAFFAHTTLSFEDLLWSLLRDLGVETRSAAKRDLIAALDGHLHRQAEAGRTTALIIDEAQNLRLEVLEELRLLSNFETYRQKLLQIVLVGQPELETTLAQPQVRQLRDRIAVRATLKPLPAALVPEYVQHRLAVAGYDGSQLFSDGAIQEIARRSGGVPRRINALCHNSLLHAYAERASAVTRAMVRASAEELAPQPTPKRRRAVWNPLPSWGARPVAAAVTVAVSLALISGVGTLLGRGPSDLSTRIAIAAAGCAPTAPRMTNPPQRPYAGTAAAPARAPAPSVPRAARPTTVERLAAWLDSLVPSSGYEEWHRMHQPRYRAWQDAPPRG